MKVPFFDRTRGDCAVEGELVEALRRLVTSGQYVLGREVEGFERRAVEYLGAAHAIGVSSGTDALLVSLMALGVGPGDEVICPAYSFFATAGAIARLGAQPVFVDVREADLAIDPEALARRVSPRTRAVVPVHLFGLAAPMDAIRQASGTAPVVEDAAQAFGARDGGRSVGTMGALGCFSFFPTKNLGGFGDGGLVTTEDAALAERVRVLRVHGGKPKHHHALVGGNFRLDALQAALLGVKLAGVDALTEGRRAHAARYRALFAEKGLLGSVELPPDTPEHTYNQFVIRVRDGKRDALRDALKEWGVGTEVYYPVALPHQPCFAHLGHRPGDFPVAEAAARDTLALPIFAELEEREVAYVVEGVARFFRDQFGGKNPM
ncbi:DegT/DnrJ/EryC1/StrS family aminotransferase [Polyangium aurulentum]|uniref:DegT/DnrJ/EryC1/StrS family aminotransferase n=1 Tax=Polyangium aurulentum TaxID=2567896 RepID=UPI0010ADE961|nr:DegT/DnrJ/EryC1/StrS family aminotransferase [Polyangium aurulentum]UQA62395.1 DegT/DnrJ/EryC1/StrS family aminotransferase [Polyangium aurulentum]